MAYLKVLLVALLGAFTGAVLWVVIGFVLPILIPLVVGRVFNRGGIGAASIGSDSILFAAIVGFVVAGAWAASRFVLAS